MNEVLKNINMTSQGIGSVIHFVLEAHLLTNKQFKDRMKKTKNRGMNGERKRKKWNF